MASLEHTKLPSDEDKKTLHQGQDVENQATSSNFDDASSLGKGDILQLEHTDPVLNAKMHLINNAIGKFLLGVREFGCDEGADDVGVDEIGFTKYQWKRTFIFVNLVL